jgi:cell division protein FtsB
MEEFVDLIPEKEVEIQSASPRRKKALSKIARFLGNKFFIATAVFLAVMLFLDKNDLFTTLERKKELQNLEESRKHFKKELSDLQKIKSGLENDPAVIEKLAREKYLMKRDNEDLFLIDDGAKNN